MCAVASLDWLVDGFDTAGRFDYFFPGDDLGIDLTYWEITLAVSYRLDKVSDISTPYLGAGINVSRYRVSTNVLGAEISGNESKTYPSILVGWVFMLGRAKPFIEGRTTFGEGGQFVASAGVRF